MTEVSVIIPTFNRSNLVIHAITSVLDQTYTDFEIVVVDDGSTDETKSMITKIRDKHLQYVYQNNSGLAAARNTGIRHSKGDLIAFLDDDDKWFPYKLEKQVNLMRSKPGVGFVNAGWVCVDNQGTALRQVTPWIWRPQLDLDTWLVACPAVPSAVIVRRKWLDKVGNFDEKISREFCGAEDWDLWLRLTYAGCSMAWLEEIVCAYRVHPESMSRNAPRQRKSMMMVLDKFFNDPEIPEAILQEKNSIYAQAHLRGAARLYSAGISGEARDDVARAIELDPRLLANDGAKLLETLIGWAGDPSFSSAIAYVKSIFNNLPEKAEKQVEKRRKASFAQAAKIAFFGAHYRNNNDDIIRSIPVMLTNDLNILTDRGFWSVIAKVFLGKSNIEKIHRFIHRSKINRLLL